MHEKGFLLGQAPKVNAICHRGGVNPLYTPDGNLKMVTVIECIAADGRVIPSMYIYKGSRHLLQCPAGMQEILQATSAWSTKGWTDNELELELVEQKFEQYTIKMIVPCDWPPVHADYYSVKDKRYIEILDGHGSHLTWQFFDFCLKRNIHPICLPAHSTHIFQQLDVGLFGLLLCCYSNELDIWVRKRGNAIKKGQFYK